MSIKIDCTDKTILRMLQDNSRTSFRKIAEKLDVSEATVFIRIRKLKSNGIIKKFTTQLDYEKIGINLTAFILINATPKKLRTVLETLSSMPDVYEAYDVTGGYYIIVKIRTESKDKLTEIIDKIGNIEGVEKTETAIVLKNIKEETSINF